MNANFDLIVIGSGPGGYKSAIIAAQLGHKVALIERAQPGGTCLNQGCVPKEALIRIAKLIDDVKLYEGLGITSTIQTNFEQATNHKNKLISSIRNSVPPWLKRLGIHFIAGDASFKNRNTILITDRNNQQQEIRAERIIIATGSRVKQHPELEINNKNIINSEQLMKNITALPKRILCVGGGAICTEMSYVFHQFGCKVSIVNMRSRILDKPHMPERASKTIERKFKQLGITVKNNTRITQHEICDDEVIITFDNNETETYDMIFVAVGREPNTNALNLHNAGVKLDKNGFIHANEYLETTCNGVYAIGDVKAGPMTANAAFHDAKIATANALNGNQNIHNYNRVPIVIDSALQIATVGLTEERAEDAGFEPDVARINLASTTKARLTQEMEGFIEVVHDEETAQLLGGCVIGPQAKEMIHTITAACQSKRGLWFFTDLNYAHPSWNEELENTIYSYVNMFTQSDEPIFQPGINAINNFNDISQPNKA